MPMSPRLLRPIASSLDPDAAVYLNAVAAADGEQLEPAVKKAINDFITGCKADGIWNAIKASCILAGARTLAGALVPLKGSAPTNNGPFVAADYNRETGLVGNGTTKYLDSNRNNNADPQDSFHAAVYVSVAAADVADTTAAYLGAGGASPGTTVMAWGRTLNGVVTYRNRNSGSFTNINTASPTGLVAMNRSQASGYSTRFSGSDITRVQSSQTPFNGNNLVFARNDGSLVPGLFCDARMAFYSIGESLNLALLDSRVTTLITAIGNAI